MLNKSVARVVTFLKYRDEQGRQFYSAVQRCPRLACQCEALGSSLSNQREKVRKCFFSFFFCCTFLSLRDETFSSEVMMTGDGEIIHVVQMLRPDNEALVMRAS